MKIDFTKKPDEQPYSVWCVAGLISLSLHTRSEACQLPTGQKYGEQLIEQTARTAAAFLRKSIGKKPIKNEAFKFEACAETIPGLKGQYTDIEKVEMLMPNFDIKSNFCS